MYRVWIEEQFFVTGGLSEFLKFRQPPVRSMAEYCAYIPEAVLIFEIQTARRQQNTQA